MAELDEEVKTLKVVCMRGCRLPDVVWWNVRVSPVSDHVAGGIVR